MGEDLNRLATIRWKSFLEDQRHGVHPEEVRNLIEAEDSLLEIHLHGPVTRDRIQEVRLLKADYDHLRDLVRRAKGRPEPLPWEFDNAEPFRKLLELMDRFEIPLVFAEE